MSAENIGASQTASMSLEQRIAHVGGRANAAGYIEFGSPQAVVALVQQVLRDIVASPRAEPPAQGPVAPAYYVTVSGRLHETEPAALAFGLPDGRHALFTTPVAAPVAQLLTDEQIDAVTVGQWGPQIGAMLCAYRAYARAIERAHGIAEGAARASPNILQMARAAAEADEARMEAQRRLEAMQDDAIRHDRDIALAVAAEREACAQACDALMGAALASQSGVENSLANVILRQVAVLGHGQCAGVIRARGAA